MNCGAAQRKVLVLAPSTGLLMNWAGSICLQPRSAGTEQSAEPKSRRWAPSRRKPGQVAARLPSGGRGLRSKPSGARSCNLSTSRCPAGLPERGGRVRRRRSGKTVCGNCAMFSMPSSCAWALAHQGKPLSAWALAHQELLSLLRLAAAFAQGLGETPPPPRGPNWQSASWPQTSGFLYNPSCQNASKSILEGGGP